MQPILKCATLLFFCFLFGNLQAQNLLSIGLTPKVYNSQLQAIIEQEGYTIEFKEYAHISTQILQDKEVLVLFNRNQTWNSEQWLDEEQATAILTFVQNGGCLYLSARQGYSNLLAPLGIQLEGKDGEGSGLEWPLIQEQITEFVAHPLSKDVNSIVTDVSARFYVDKDWQIIGKNKQAVPMLATKTLGKGKIVLCSGERTFRDAATTTNRYESDISQGNNHQFFENLFHYFLDAKSDSPELTKSASKDILQITPNPTTNQVIVSGNAIEQIEILSTNGQVLRQINGQQKTQLQVDLSSFPTGLYWFRIKTAEGIQSKEVVLMD